MLGTFHCATLQENSTLSEMCVCTYPCVCMACVYMCMCVCTSSICMYSIFSEIIYVRVHVCVLCVFMCMCVCTSTMCMYSIPSENRKDLCAYWYACICACVLQLFACIPFRLKTFDVRIGMCLYVHVYVLQLSVVV